MEACDFCVLSEVEGILNRHQREACTLYGRSHEVVLHGAERESCRAIARKAVGQLHADVCERLCLQREHIPLLVGWDKVLSEMLVYLYT